MINHPSDEYPASITNEGSHQKAVPYGVLGVDEHGALESQTFKVNANKRCLTTGEELDQEDWHCCCGCHVRTATLWIGGIYIVPEALALILLTIFAVVSSPYFSPTNDSAGLPSKVEPSWEKVPGTGDKGRYSNGAKTLDKIAVVMIPILLIHLISNSLMILGALKYKPKLMIPYLIINVLVISFRIFGLLIVLLLAISEGISGILISVVSSSLELILMVYATLIVRRCYNYLQMCRRSLTTN